MLRSALLPVAAVLLAAPAALAQTYDPTVTHHYFAATQVWPQVQVELLPDSSNYLTLGVQGRRYLDRYDYGRSLGFDARQAQLGYEHFASSHWSFGGTVRLYGDGVSGVIPEVLLRHRSRIFGGLTFGQRLSVERTFGDIGPLESGPAGQFWGRLRADVERPLRLGSGGLVLRPRLGYEAATHLRLQKADNEPDERTIQYTSLRAELGLRVSDVVDLTPWFARQTRYLTSLVQYDQNGAPTAGGKLNYVFPTFGLDLRFTLRPAGRPVPGRQRLPTQH